MSLHTCFEQYKIITVPEQCVLLTYLYLTLDILLMYQIINHHVLNADWNCPCSTIVIFSCSKSITKSKMLLLFYTDISNTILYMVMYVYVYMIG